MEIGLARLFNSHVPTHYWVDAFSTMTFVIDKLPSKILDNTTPFDILYSRVPSYHNFRVFGCLVFPYLRDYAKNKLSPRSLPCVFLGYSSQYNGYRCLNPVISQVFITRHTRFDE